MFPPSSGHLQSDIGNILGSISDLLEKPVKSEISIVHMTCILLCMFQISAWR